MAESQTSERKSNPKVLGVPLRVLITGILVSAVGGGIVWILSLLWDLRDRVSALEAYVQDLREIVLKKVVTETITVTYTTTGATPPPSPISGYPLESILAGLLLGLLVVLLIHRSR